MDFDGTVLTLRDDDPRSPADLAAAERGIREALARMDRAAAGRPRAVLPGAPIAGAAAGPRGPLIGTLHVTVEREHPRAIQAGVERALAELGERAELAGALD
jgi:hypothetical protein